MKAKALRLLGIGLLGGFFATALATSDGPVRAADSTSFERDRTELTAAPVAAPPSVSAFQIIPVLPTDTTHNRDDRT